MHELSTFICKLINSRKRFRNLDLRGHGTLSDTNLRPAKIQMMNAIATTQFVTPKIL